jgi:hypothetical protein
MMGLIVTESSPRNQPFLNRFHTIPFSFLALNGLFVRVFVRVLRD